MMRTTIAAVSAAALLALAGCGSDSDEPAADASFNKADVTFAQQMIPHHEQAVEMARLAATRASDPAVKELAAAIEAAQAPEIETMTAWLKEWGADVPDGESDSDMDHSGMDHSGDMDGMGGMGGMGDDDNASSDMQGMMSEAQMADLEASSGAAFDRAFLTMMIAHHEGAVVMAKAEQADGKDPDAKELAGAIIDTQTREIATMKGLLGS